MRKLFYTSLLLTVWCTGVSTAQQDPMFTNYHFNSLVFNPAYAGSNEHLTANLLHRQQWLGFEGAPVTQTLAVHSPLRNIRVGGGLSMVHEKIGPASSLEMNLAYAYRMLIGKKKNMKLSIGLQAGVTNWHADLIDVVVEQGSDPSFQENFTRWLPNFGAGLHLSGKRFYASLGCPRLLENDLRQAKNDNVDYFAKTYRHWYTAVGAVIPVNSEQLIFRPSLLLKSTGFASSNAQQRIGSPTALNLDFAFFVRQTFWFGATFRTAVQVSKSSFDSVDFWGAWCMRNGLRLGAAYDVTLSKLQKAGASSFELMLGYEFDIKVKQVASPRYF